MTWYNYIGSSTTITEPEDLSVDRFVMVNNTTTSEILPTSQIKSFFKDLKSVPDNGLRNLFYNNKGLTGEVPDLSKITSVGNCGLYYTFQNCTGLTGTPDLSKITSVGNYGLSHTFANCDGLTGIPDLSNITSVGEYGLEYTFYYCNRLTGTPDLSNITSVGTYGLQYTFQNCTGLTGTPKLPNITTIPNYGLSGTFSGCTGLTGEIPDLSNITSVGEYGLYYTFYNCSKLTGTPILPNITEIPSNGLNGTFSGCTGLTGTIPDLSNITSVGYRGLYDTFFGCTGLTGTPDLSNITSVGNYGLRSTFFECTGLTGEIPDFSNLTSVGENGLEHTFFGCTGLTGEIPDFSNLTSVATAGLSGTFSGCTGLTGTPKLPNITTVPSSGLYETFRDCTGLTGTPDLSNITSVGQYGLAYTFQGCTELTGTPDLSNITSVGDHGLYWTFYGCTGLTGDVYFSSLDPTKVSIKGTTNTTNPFYQCFYQCKNIDSVHFPYNLTSTQKSYLTNTVIFGGADSIYKKETAYITFDLNVPFTYLLSSGSVTHTNLKGETTTYTGQGTLFVNGGEKLIFTDVTPKITGCTLDTDGTIIPSSVTGDISATFGVVMEVRDADSDSTTSTTPSFTTKLNTGTPVTVNTDSKVVLSNVNVGDVITLDGTNIKKSTKIRYSGFEYSSNWVSSNVLEITITKLKDFNPYIWVNLPNMMNVGNNYLWNNGGSDVIGTGSKYTAYRDVFYLSSTRKLDIVGFSRSATNTIWFNNMISNTIKSYEDEWTSNTSEIIDVKNGTKHLLDDVTSIGNYCLAYVFKDNKTITELPDLSNIITVDESGLSGTFCYCTGLTGTPNFSNLTSVGNYGLQNTFYGCTGLTGTPDLSNITTLGYYGLASTFQGCTGLTGTPDLSNITSVGNFGLYWTFYGCTGLTGTPKLPNITSVGRDGLNNTFHGCTGLSGIPDLSNITSVGESGLYATFYGCTGLTGTPDLSNITSVGTYGLGSTFDGCTGLTGDVYFSSLDPSKVTITGTTEETNPFYYCFYQCTGIDSVHFPASLTDTQKSYLTKTVLFGGETEEYCKPTLQILFDL